MFLFPQTIFAGNGGGLADPGGAIGQIEKTPGLDRFDSQAGGIGLLLFISTLMRLATIIAGVWVLFNILLAGYTYLTSSGDSGAHSKVQNKVTLSIMGLILIVITYTVIGIISFFFFGDASYILNPVINGTPETIG